MGFIDVDEESLPAMAVDIAKRVIIRSDGKQRSAHLEIFSTRSRAQQLYAQCYWTA